MTRSRGEIELLSKIYLPPMFSVVVPEATINEVTNPSAEYDLVGYSAGPMDSIARIDTVQMRGAYGIEVTPGGTPSSILYGTVSPIVDQTYTFSLDLLGTPGVTYYMSIIQGALDVAFAVWVGTGYPQRVHLTYHNQAAVATTLGIAQMSTTKTWYVDGFQFERKPYPTTYTDGDLGGFVLDEAAYGWTGAYHASESYRSSTTRSGGRIVSLKEYGFSLLGSIGLGLSPVSNYSLPSNLGGAYYQNTIDNVRPFTLVGDIIEVDNSLLSQKRGELEEVLSHKLTPYNQPLLLYFQELDSCNTPIGQGTFIKCLYEGGLERTYDNLNGEKLLLRFTVFDREGMWVDGDKAIPISYGHEVLEHGGFSLLDRTSGEWEGLGVGADAASISAGGGISCIVKDSRGRLYVAGSFASMNGVLAANIAYYENGVWNALGAGTNGPILDMVYYGGYIYVVGNFALAGGGAAISIARCNVSTGVWSAIGAGLALGGGGGIGYTLCVGRDGYIYVGGNFDTAIGVACSNIARIDTSTMAASSLAMGASNGVNDFVYDIISNESGVIYACGDFSTAGTLSVAEKVAKWYYNAGTSYWEDLDGGLDIGIVSSALCMDFLKSGEVVVGGTMGTAGSDSITIDAFTFWNGYQWIPGYSYSWVLGIGEIIPYRIQVDSSNTIHIVGTASTTGVSSNASYILATLNTDCNGDTVAGDVISNTSCREAGCRLNRNNAAGGTMMGILVENGRVFIGGSYHKLFVGSRNIYNSTCITFPKFRIDNPSTQIGAPATLKNYRRSSWVNLHSTVLPLEESTIEKYRWESLERDRTQFLSPSGVVFEIDDGEDRVLRYFGSTECSETGDNNNQIYSYELITGITLTNSTNGQLSIDIINDGGGFFHVHIYRESARTLLVGHTASHNAAGMRAIIEDNNSGLGGFVWFNPVAADNNIELFYNYLDIHMIYPQYISSLGQARYV